MEGDDDTISFQQGEEHPDAPAEATATTTATEDEVIQPGESSVSEKPAETDTTTTTTTTSSSEAAAGGDDVLEIPKDAMEDFGGCFVEVVGKGMYQPARYKTPAPAACMTKAEAAPVPEEPLPENASGWASFVYKVKNGITAGQKDRTKERCVKSMKLFKDLPRGQAPFVPPEDVVPVNDFRCHCVINSDVNGTKSPYIAQGWLTVTQTALVFSGSINLSPARPMSVPEPVDLDVAFAIDIETIVSVVAASCEDGDDAEVLSCSRMPKIVTCDSVDAASALILFDRSGHAHQFYDFVWGFTNYAPDAIRNIIYQCNFPESAAAAAVAEEPAPVAEKEEESAPAAAEEAVPVVEEPAPEESSPKKEEEEDKPADPDVVTISEKDDSVVS